MSTYRIMLGDLQAAISEDAWRKFTMESLGICPPFGQSAFDFLCYNDQLSSRHMSSDLSRWLRTTYRLILPVRAALEHYRHLPSKPPHVHIQFYQGFDYRSAFFTLYNQLKISPGDDLFEFYCRSSRERVAPPGQSSLDFLRFGLAD